MATSRRRRTRAPRSFFEEKGSIDSLKGMLQEVRNLGRGSLHQSSRFRGQADSCWKLTPTIGRPSRFHAGRRIDEFSPKQEKDLLHRFRRHTYLHFNRWPDHWEALFLARHHGLPVRLLDWTANPLVALYHACCYEEPCTCDAALWAFVPTGVGYIDVSRERRHPTGIRGVKIIHPFYPTPRMIAQASVFTIQHNPWRPLEEHSPRKYAQKNFDLTKVLKWTVRADARSHILKDLDALSINRRTLYPELDGLAEGLLHTEIFRSGKRAPPG